MSIPDLAGSTLLEGEGCERARKSIAWLGAVQPQRRQRLFQIAGTGDRPGLVTLWKARRENRAPSTKFPCRRIGGVVRYTDVCFSWGIA